MRILAISLALLIAAGSSGCAHTPISLPYNEKLMDENQGQLYVDDANVFANIPWLKTAGKRLWTCLSGLPEHTLIVHYAPQVIAPHTAKLNLLWCRHESGQDHVECDNVFEDETAYFDTSSDRYFTLAPGSSLEEAMALFRALSAHDLTIADGVSDPHLEKTKGPLGTIKQKGNAFEVTYPLCGCSGEMTVARRQGADHEWSYVVIKNGMGLCI